MNYILPVLILIASIGSGCKRSSEFTPEARERLLANKRWHIEEIRMNEAPVFKEGKHLPHISGVRFDQHMDWIEFAPDGSCKGHFTETDDIRDFQWKEYPVQNVLALRDSVTKTGGWNIYPRNVYEDSFEMETRSTVYDPPRVSKLSLRFVRREF
ncbi:hypothetical protein [Arundinibacter roseus]|uniref:Lipocalin-like domain-containing protein n=1 Tax=Arundinibacter roseus TaxID=2070510 RepID=A0A4R4KED1_9BACT|nr:hypothetical protein [Arundinibacter roseus]TDB66083.1 hypothetical protein EZE20_10020 [Arundinibacter roseus]